MMDNPFDDNDARFLILVNGNGQYSLWPLDIDVPVGWHIAYGDDTRARCLEFVTERWIDLAPRP